ncbi:MAG: hypothetical protein ACN6OW_22205 [Sphingobacterium paramultivorum]
MKILKIDRGSVEIEIDNSILRISGEAMLVKQLPELSEYVLYKNTFNWINTATQRDIDEEALFLFLRKEFVKRNLLLVVE